MVFYGKGRCIQFSMQTKGGWFNGSQCMAYLLNLLKMVSLYEPESFWSRTLDHAHRIMIIAIYMK